jgi:alcohol dehydrogenase class IV
MEYNLPVRTKELADVARALGEKIEKISPKEAARKAIAEVHEIIRDVGLPTRMRDIGVKEKDIRPMAEATMLVTRLLRSNPRRVNVDTIEEIFKRAF